MSDHDEPAVHYPADEPGSEPYPPASAIREQDPWTFTDPDGTGLTLEEALGQALGGASACWENLRGAGVFDSTRCKQILNTLKEWVWDWERRMRGGERTRLELLRTVGPPVLARPGHEVVDVLGQLERWLAGRATPVQPGASADGTDLDGDWVERLHVATGVPTGDCALVLGAHFNLIEERKQA